MIPEHIKVKLQKLFAFEEGARNIGSLHEAENAALRIQEILMNYNLQREDIKEKSKYKIKYIELVKYYKKNEGRWIVSLFANISQHNMCDVITQSIPKTHLFDRVLILGEEVNIEIVEYTVEQLIPVLRYLSKDAWKAYNGPEKRNAFIRGFLQGAVWGVSARLAAELNHIRTENVKADALVLHEKAKVREFRDEQFPTLGKEKKSSLTAFDGQRAGYKKGKELSIKKGLNGDSNALNQKLIK